MECVSLTSIPVNKQRTFADQPSRPPTSVCPTDTERVFRDLLPIPRLASDLSRGSEHRSYLCRSLCVGLDDYKVTHFDTLPLFLWKNESFTPNRTGASTILIKLLSSGPLDVDWPPSPPVLKEIECGSVGVGSLPRHVLLPSRVRVSLYGVRSDLSTTSGGVPSSTGLSYTFRYRCRGCPSYLKLGWDTEFMADCIRRSGFEIIIRL